MFLFTCWSSNFESELIDLLQEKIKKYSPQGVTVISQADIVAHSLQDYLHRHPEIETRISKNGQRLFYTTDSAVDFNNKATIFFGETVQAQHTELWIHEAMLMAIATGAKPL